MYEIRPIDGSQGKIIIEVGKDAILKIKGYCKGLQGFKDQVEILRQEGLLK